MTGIGFQLRELRTLFNTAQPSRRGSATICAEPELFA